MRPEVRWVLAAVAAAVAGALGFLAVATSRDAETVARLVAGVLMFVVPGGLTVSALFAGRELSSFARAMMSLAFGVCLVILAGWVLALLPVTLDRTSWLAVLGAVVATALVGALWRREPGATGAPHVDRRSLAINLFAVACAALILFQALDLVRDPALSAPPTRFTQLWILPSTSTELEIGVWNAEGLPMNYDLVVRIGDREVGRTAVDLRTDGRWSGRVPLGSASAATPLEVELYRPGDRLAYRTVQWRP